MELDYKSELKKISDFAKKNNNNREWFRPSTGIHKIKILKIGREYSVTFRNQEIPKRLFVIECDGKKYNWGVTKSQSDLSLWGQLMVLGSVWGSLEGREITLIVKESGDERKRKDYTISEAIQYTAKG